MCHIENIKDAKDIMEWDCKEQHDLIHSGRASIKAPQKKICFNKGIAEARRLFAENKGITSDDKNKTLNEAATSSKGKKSSEISVKQNNKTGAHERLNMNDSKEFKTNSDEPKVKRSKGIICENLVRRTSPRKAPVKKEEVHVNKRNSVTAKEVSNAKERSTQFVGKANENMKNEIAAKNSPVSKRKRKRQEVIKQNRFSAATLESTNEELNDSESPVKLSKKQGKNDAKQKITENKQQTKNVDKRTFPNDGKDDNSHRMEQGNSKENNDEGEWESDSCSDEELMEAALSPSSKDFKFELNDVVWAKLYRDPFWPAQVKRIIGNKKAKKIYVQFLGYDNKSCFSCKRVVPFACDSEKREEFVKDAMELDPQRFDEALVMAEDMVRRKALGIKEQNEEDKEVCKLVDTDDVEENSNDSKVDTSSVTDDKPEKETIVRKSSRNVKRPSKYKDILTYIREAKPFLKDIFEEKKACERHEIFKKGSAKEKNSLKRRSGFGPVADTDLEDDIMELLQDFYRELVGNKEDFSEITYISDVWLPEAIIYAVQKIERVDRKTAEYLFRRGSSQGTRSHRFTQRLKAKALTQEERKESVQRAEKSFRISLNL
ncbi:PWWP domain-containing protein 2A-like isoform X2 [Actinia tenebrosa]|uniref:PWWP domain-containing protein 2A-like isoform X2 n=1 Tax=Actinia tenebrosa TaxID=6105 RepID=A0A6P8I915_ACTTE|nr:PWWP domain-containing protein 2A-like isoform X2 [Actinia tenebrosa]